MKKLIYMIENFFIERDFDRFDLQYYFDNNVDIEIWDITQFANSNFLRLIKPKDEIKKNYVKKFKSINDIENALRSIDNTKTLFAAEITFDIRTISIFKLFSKYKIKYFVNSGTFVTSDPRYNKKNILKRFKLLFKKEIGTIINYLQNLLLRIFGPRFFGVSDVPIYFKEAEIAEQREDLNRKIIGKNTKIILSHPKDYDTYLKCKKQNSDQYKCDAVLIDQMIGFHNDNIRVGEKQNPEEWYKSLKIFFNYLKKNYSIDTTICAHPRSNGEINNFISDYPIIKNKTPDLIKNCSFVICQNTSAVTFAALFNKPMIFIYNHIEMKNKSSKIDHAGRVDFFASFFKKKPISIENLKNLDLKKELKIDQKSYQDFIKKYIKSWGTDKPKSEVILELLTSQS